VDRVSHLRLVQPYSKDEQTGDGDAQAETKAVPAAVRAAVLERDGHSCRVCGSYAKEPAVHHISYRSEGGLHVVENLVTVHWMYEPRCHERAHADKGLWQPLLAEVVKHDGMTAMGLLRRYRAAQGCS
jgi:hypothetical protein